jgi:exonuclease III
VHPKTETANLIELSCNSSIASIYTGSRERPVRYSKINYKNLTPVARITERAKDKMCIGYLNARSVSKKACEIADFICDKCLDVCSISETWLGKGSQYDIVCGELTPMGYKLEHVPRNTGRGGGVAVLYKTSVKCKKQKVDRYSSFELLELVLTTRCDSIRLCVVYRPPAGGKHSKSFGTFLTEFQNYISSLSTSTGKLLVLGDFNIHVDRKESAEAKKFADMLYSLNLEQHISMPTHERGHILDLVLTRPSDLPLSDLEIHPAMMSDHLPITFRVSVCRPAAVKKTIHFRKLKDIDVNAFQQDLLASPLITLPASDVETLVDQYNTELTLLMDAHAPHITKEVFIRSNAPWYTKDIADAKSRRRQGERLWRSSGLAVHLQMLRVERIHYNDLCKKAKADYYQSKISENCTDQKALFKITNQLLHKTKDVTLPTHDSEKELADKFSTFFENKIRVISQSFEIGNPPLDSNEYNSLGARPLTSYQSVSKEDVRKLVMSGNSKSCHLDPIPTSLLKDCIDYLLPCLTRIVNLSLASCKVPQPLKTATVTPLLKKPNLDSEDLKNYRPVSNLPYLSKVIEKVVVGQVDSHMTEQGLYQSHQSAYRKGHSTETALVKILDDVLCSVDGSECVFLVLLDQSAAFDTVNQEYLLRRLDSTYGI